MKRLILDKLLVWKKSPYRKPLILKGVRQVGKTWVLKELGRLYYESVAYFNFEENPEFKQFFQLTKDVNRILQNLMLVSSQKIEPDKTLIIFDEVQDCPEVINSLKYFCENAPHYHEALRKAHPFSRSVRRFLSGSARALPLRSNDGVPRRGSPKAEPDEVRTGTLRQPSIDGRGRKDRYDVVRPGRTPRVQACSTTCFSISSSASSFSGSGTSSARSRKRNSPRSS